MEKGSEQKKILKHTSLAPAVEYSPEIIILDSPYEGKEFQGKRVNQMEHKNIAESLAPAVENSPEFINVNSHCQTEEL